MVALARLLESGREHANESRGAARAVESFGGTPSAPFTMFGSSLPAPTTLSDSNAVQLATMFYVTETGYITALRCPRRDPSTQTFKGYLYNGTTGALLGEVTFPTGAYQWVEAALPAPVAVGPGQLYCVAYWKDSSAATDAYYTAPHLFDAEVTASKFVMPAGGVTANGRYRYQGVGSADMPVDTFNNTCYFADVVFEPGPMLYSDNFNRADAGSLGTPWTIVEMTINIVSNKAAVTTSGGAHVAFYNQPISNDQWAEGDMTVGPTTYNSLGPAVRVGSATGDPFYYAWWSPTGNVLQLWKRSNASTYVQVGGDTATAPGSFRVRVEVEGTTVRMFKDGVQVVSATDTWATTGKPGLVGDQGGPQPTLDNFRCGDMPYVPAGPVLLLTRDFRGGGNYVTGFATTPFDLPDWSVTAGELLVVALGGCGADSAQAAQWSLTGGGLTWTKRVEALQTTQPYRAVVAIFTAVATTTTTITDMVGAGTNVLQVMYAMYRSSGYDSGGPVGAVAGLADDSADGQKDITLNTTPATSSIILSLTFENMDENRTDKTLDHGASDGWTEDFDFGPSMTGGSMWGCWMAQRKTGHTITRVRVDDIHPASYTGTTYSFAGAAIEIKAAP